MPKSGIRKKDEGGYTYRTNPNGPAELDYYMSEEYRRNPVTGDSPARRKARAKEGNRQEKDYLRKPERSA